MKKMGHKLILIGPVTAKDSGIDELELSQKDFGDILKVESTLTPLLRLSDLKDTEIGLIVGPYEPAIVYNPE